jgi:hypothetical protein
MFYWLDSFHRASLEVQNLKGIGEAKISFLFKIE